MKFSDIVESGKALLQRKGRITRRALAREFGLDDEVLQDLVDELVLADRVASLEEDGRVLSWSGEAAAPERPGPDEASEGDRRQITVMFCDLVGSTELSERLDPEDLHRLVTAYQRAVLRVVERYEGHVAQYLGDGILAYFGHPRAHEDDAVRAVRAGLDILEEIDRMPVTPRVQVRLGLHSGPVVIGAVGEAGRSERLALGRTPNIAARVQGAAEPQTLLISAATHRLVHGLFDCRSLGERVLKGVAEPVSMHQVIGNADDATRFDLLVRQQRLKPLRGRGAEFEALMQAWQQARAGRGRLAQLSGEPGIGKSRLVRALFGAATGEGAQWLSLRCSPFHAGSPLHPLAEHWNRLLGADGDDDAAARRRRLEQMLEPLGLADPDTLALIAEALSIPLHGGRGPGGTWGEAHKRKTLQALGLWLLRLAERSPLLVAFEDLHWADPTTLEFLELLAPRLAGVPAMLLVTYRSGFDPPWPVADDALNLPLPRLQPEDIAELAAATCGQPLAPDALDLLVRKTDGVPLFVEELTKDLLESGRLEPHQGRMRLAGPPADALVPFSLQDSLTSRLDRLGPVRRLAEVAAVLGREFSHAWIGALHDGEPGTLDDGLRALCDADILLRQDEASGPLYVFRHALLRDAAYGSLLIRRRQQIHARVAGLLETEWAGTAEAQPELLAHHHAEAGCAERAIENWQRAGLRAVERSANQEAVRHFGAALSALRTLPEGPARDRQELSLLMGLGVPLTVTTSWAAPEVLSVSERALRLCEALGESAQMFRAVFGVWSGLQVRADYRAASPLTDRLLVLAKLSGDDGLLLQAHRAHGIVALHTGRFEEALRHCEAGFALYDPARHRAQVLQYWLDPGVGCLCYGAWTLACIGRLDDASRRVLQAEALARDGGHDFSLAYAIHFAAVVSQMRREPAAVRERARELLDLSAARGFPVFQAWGTLLLGWVQAAEGRPAEGIALIRQAQQTTRAAGARVARSGSLAVLADVCQRAGETDAGLEAVDEAMSFVEQSDERFFEAELLRLRAELLLQQGAPESVRLSVLVRAVALARSQGARAWELRAATSLARLHLGAGHERAAQELLVPLLARIDDESDGGSDGADLREARALLASARPARAV